MNATNIKFQIKHIELLEFSFKHPNRNFPENSRFRFDMQLKQSLNLEENNVIVVSQYKIFHDDEKEQIADAKISCIFHLHDIKQYSIESTEFSLSEQLITILNSISISTSRGVLFSLFKGTPLQTVILPIVNPMEINKEAEN